MAAGLLYTYAAGTTTPSATYSDRALTTANANPIVLDSAGRATIYLAASSYKFVLKDSEGTTIWTQDDMTATHVGQAPYDQTFFGGQVDAYSYDTSYPAGTAITSLARGAGVLYEDPANLTGAYVLDAIVKTDHASGVVTICLVNLSDGSPDTAMTGSEVSSSGDATAAQRVRSGLITFPAGGSAKTFGVKLKTNNAAYGANVYTARLVRTA